VRAQPTAPGRGDRAPRGEALTDAVFVTEPQPVAARGDAATRLPEWGRVRVRLLKPALAV